MTRDDIIEMAREAGLCKWVQVPKIEEQELTRFAALVAAHEREECAKVLEAHPSYDLCRCPCECASAIRARPL